MRTVHDFEGFPKISNIGINVKSAPYEQGDNVNWRLEEKLDGSNFWFHADDDGSTLVCGNKGKRVTSKFSTFTKTIQALTLLLPQLNPEYMYMGEAMPRPKSVTLTYDHAPPYYVVLFDIKMKSTGEMLPWTAVAQEASRLGLMSTQIIHDNAVSGANLNQVLADVMGRIESGELTSCLGGRIEGVVLKHPTFLVKRKHVARIKKCVSRAFKEVHGKKQLKGEMTLSNAEMHLLEMGRRYATIPRFTKAVQRAKEQGLLTEDRQKDAHVLIRDLSDDLLDEHRADLEQIVWDYFQEELGRHRTEHLNRMGNVVISDVDDAHLKQLLFIEWWPVLSKGSREGFFGWYMEEESKSTK